MVRFAIPQDKFDTLSAPILEWIQDDSKSTVWAAFIVLEAIGCKALEDQIIEAAEIIKQHQAKREVSDG